MSHLQTVFQLLLQHQLFVKYSKCAFGATQIEYLGHVITKDGVAMNQGKIQSILQWPYPHSVKEVRGFLGLTGYYRRFIRNYGIIAQPITALLKTNSFVWTEEARETWDRLKQAMVTAPVLALPDFQSTFVVESNASNNGIGAVLSQKGRPIAFFSKALSPKQQATSVYKKEMLAVLTAVKKWTAYLLGRHFLIKTDHHSLKFLLDQKTNTPAQQVWVIKMMGYDYDLVFRKGSKNVVADALSRIPQVALQAITFCSNDLLARIKQSWLQDPKMIHLMHKAKGNTSLNSKYTWQA